MLPVSPRELPAQCHLSQSDHRRTVLQGHISRLGDRLFIIYSDLGTTVKTAYGPYGMNKIVQNHIEKLFLTSDAATMIRELDIKHPAAKMVVMAAHQQEEEAGDGTNGVVILCSAILAEAEYLLRMGLSVPEVVSGLKTALSYAQEQLESLTIHSGKIFKNLSLEPWN